MNGKKEGKYYESFIRFIAFEYLNYRERKCMFEV